MTASTAGLSRFRRTGTIATAALAAVALGVVPGARAEAAGDTLPRRRRPDGGAHQPCPDVTLTRIERGSEPAPADQINTTTRGPWVVNLLTIDPSQARGHLQATYGPNLSQVEKTMELVRAAGALAGVNASFFTFTASQLYRGDPVGLGLFGGKLVSGPTADPAEVNFVVDANSKRALTRRASSRRPARPRCPRPGRRSPASPLRCR